ncbi:hypothetical protein [Phocicoccus pinnipedialis]|uniref:Uncharacterized protein n=1 Tax=Phocicoccus pinnipedialis TaxID=110845 RepID=A0A6V7R4Q9_9BACL|nr:hypothetical protein [Jeotgalicoccus pinnipedialis]MBP1940037.1 hypothetical protein [Jeotgalicoccus pinnipedialis]CAD2072015.1 hypothetical protein JEOPIN946_00213 [Jeotgalicoccus pinnipedialis]
MRKRILNEIHEELDKYEASNDDKHLYAVERLVAVLKEDKNMEVKEEPKERKIPERKNLDGLLLAEEKTNATSIFDF